MKKIFISIRDWVKNYGYAYKLTAVVAAVVLGIAIYLIVHYATLVNPDYVVVVASQENNFIVSQRNAMQACLEEYGEDVNGDGKVVVELFYATLYGNEHDANSYAAERTRLAVELNAKRWGIVAFDGEAYEYMQQAELLPQGAYQDDEGNFSAWNWKESKFYRDVNELSETNAELYFGVRDVPENAPEKVRQAAENGKKLLERVVNGEKIHPAENAD